MMKVGTFLLGKALIPTGIARIPRATPSAGRGGRQIDAIPVHEYGYGWQNVVVVIVVVAISRLSDTFAELRTD